MSTEFDLDKVRLEVEIPQTENVNIIRNPSGQSGAWGWLTPVNNTLMTTLEATETTITRLSFKTTVSQAAYFTSELVPVVSGKYYNARIDVTGITSGHNVKMRFAWYDSARALLSTSTQSVAYGVGTNFYGSVVVPAGASYVALRVDIYNGIANPVAGAVVNFNQAMVTYTDTGTPFSKRTNLIPNPSFEVGTTNWFRSDTVSTSLGTTTTAITGSKALSLTKTSTNALIGWLMEVSVGGDPLDDASSSWIAVSPGKDYTVQMQMRTNTSTNRDAVIVVDFYKSNGNSAQGSAIVSGTTRLSTSAWTLKTFTVTAPTDAAYIKVYARMQTAGGRNLDVGESLYVDAAMLEQSSTVKSYFDGSFTDTATLDYAWTGTAHGSASTSTTTANTFDFNDAQAWQNILGPTSEIAWNRDSLNVGTLNANILDASLDPAIADTIRPGRQIRLLANIDTGWDTIYSGRITNASTVYDKEKKIDGEVKTEITIEASDSISVLANQAENRVVTSISDLPGILEGKSVPWNINGSGNQIASFVTKAYNDNASAVDIVAIARDTALGYAWVDRYGVLNGSTSMPTTPLAYFGDAPLPSETVTNLITNPSMANGVTGWTTTNTPLPGRVYATFGLPEKSLRIDWVDGANGNPQAQYSLTGLTVGQTYTASAYIFVQTGSPDVQFSAGPSSFQTLTTKNAWVRMSTTFVATSTAHNIIVRSAGTTAGFTWVDNMMLTEGETLYDYFDGDSPYATWTGTPGESTSVLHGEALSYSDIAVDFSTDTCINSVTVKYLRYNANTKQTDEIEYPAAVGGQQAYQDPASIATWGVHAAEFTICMASESPSAIAAYANSILAANATPQVKCHSLTMPVRSDNEMRFATILDLYSLVNVAYADKIDKAQRITSIEGSIVADANGAKWTVTYGFDGVESVAQPTWIPSPPGVSASNIPFVQGGTFTINLSAQSTNIGNFTFPVAFAAPPIAITYTTNFRNIVANHTGTITATGASCRIYTADGTNTTNTVTVHWIAVGAV